MKTGSIEHFDLEKKPLEGKKTGVYEVFAGSFSHDGSQILIGNSSGSLMIYSSQDLSLVKTIALGTKSGVSRIAYSGNLQQYMIFTADRIRLYDKSHNFKQEFRDKVNNAKFRCGCFSGKAYLQDSGNWDSLHLAAANGNKVWIWDLETNEFVLTLDGPMGTTILAIDWHPKKPMIAAATDDGKILLWTKSMEENWSAFAPDFQEIHENIMFIEREDEYDRNRKPDEPIPEKLVDEDVTVDISGGSNFDKSFLVRVPKFLEAPKVSKTKSTKFIEKITPQLRKEVEKDIRVYRMQRGEIVSEIVTEIKPEPKLEVSHRNVDPIPSPKKTDKIQIAPSPNTLVTRMKLMPEVKSEQEPILSKDQTPVVEDNYNIPVVNGQIVPISEPLISEKHDTMEDGNFINGTSNFQSVLKNEDEFRGVQEDKMDLVENQ